jgi:hypothetical protein
MESFGRKLLGYGVWRVPVKIEGLPAIWAVDAFGVVQKVRKIRPGEDEQALGDRLFAWLCECPAPGHWYSWNRDLPLVERLVDDFCLLPTTP